MKQAKLTNLGLWFCFFSSQFGSKPKKKQQRGSNTTVLHDRAINQSKGKCSVTCNTGLRGVEEQIFYLQDCRV